MNPDNRDEGPPAARSRGPFARLRELRSVRAPIAIGAVIAVIAAAGWASWSYRQMREVSLEAHFLPSFEDPPAGRRAPGSEAFGVRVGGSSLEEVRRLLGQMGLSCPDTSARALLVEGRAARQREAEERKRKGLPPDAVSSASRTGRRSSMEHNPQVRLSCEGLPTERLTDRPRPASVGRLLFVFDSPRHPLRHVSFQRSLPDPATGLAELQAAVAAYSARFGPPTRTPAGPASDLPWLTPVDYEWRFADLAARITALNFGGTRGTSFTELVEVPLPLRPDAPFTARR